MVITVTTVGFGDLVPRDDASKIVTIFFILTAVLTIGGAISALSRWAFQKRHDAIKKAHEIAAAAAKLNQNAILRHAHSEEAHLVHDFAAKEIQHAFDKEHGEVLLLCIYSPFPFLVSCRLTFLFLNCFIAHF